MPIALVTGVAGFTGRYMADALRQEGYRVVGMTQGESQLEQDIFHCDLLDRTALANLVKRIQPDYVVHLAAIAAVTHGDAESIYRTNIVGTRNLLETLESNSKTPNSVLLASSANIYGNSQDEPITELATPLPANDYAVSKLCMEYMARLWVNKLPITIVRPFNYTGVGQSLGFLLPKIVDHFKRRAVKIELGNLDVARDFSDVRMVVATYCRLLKFAPTGKVFNVCSGCAYTLQEVLTMMAKISGYKIDVQVNPALVRENDVKYLRGSNAKIVAEIGEIEMIPFHQTLQWMWASNSQDTN